MSIGLNPLSAVLGSQFMRRRLLAPEIYDSQAVSYALKAIEDRWPEDGKSHDRPGGPIFILSAGWGSGSTLVQRLVMSSREVLVWGEPFDQGIPIQRLCASLTPFRQGWPPEEHFNQERDLDKLAREWVANLAPHFTHFKHAHRAFLDTWLGGGVSTGPGAARWGLKEVRFTIDHARYLKWLYPNARFLFVYRDLYSSYLSCKGVNWYSVWPRYKVSPPLAFAHQWKLVLEGFIEGHNDVGGLLIRYEDLVSGTFQVTELSGYLGVSSIDQGLLEKKVGSRYSSKKVLSVYDRLALHSVAGALRKQLGYERTD